MQIASPAKPDADSGICTPRSAFQSSRSRCIRTKENSNPANLALNPPLLTPPPAGSNRGRKKEATVKNGEWEYNKRKGCDRVGACTN
ncbi:hypothetical protein COLO4_19620 [Corchorus olitorius]|uniref:Uncharacterized protein n=1 Tax=Corchorus olitorius TaxID=93759 RepID=A0A1R3J4H4_9ROSI|nr:hypothetical protein COLO4_19620 [Corchorus olitorius]